MQEARLLVVDDEPGNIMLLEDILLEANRGQICSCSNPYDVVSLYRDFKPDLILLDLMMPGLDGLGVMQQLKEEGGGRIPVPVVVLTADISDKAKRQALAAGAKDFLHKPFDMVELMLRIDNLLETRFLHLDLQRQNETLEERVQARTQELKSAKCRIAQYARDLEETHVEMLERLALAGEFRDDDTGQHTHRVGRTTGLLAQAMGLPEAQVRCIEQAARLHDVGKIGISDTILLKPGRLTPEEFAIIKTHTTIGAALFENGHSELVQTAHRIALSHHERWDGKGYPHQLKGEEIPLEARLLSVADVFDALTHDRPYKTAWPIAEALAEIKRQSGQQFEPQVVEIFETLPHEELI
ncbi:cyclic di-GMP phosphodiesterase response regulator RpfG [Abditibacteriota bacterium]|nr:cyclic di-GMP phosphodiesterase response regulator RpfG [Abditibacteriota bacterium]